MAGLVIIDEKGSVTGKKGDGYPHATVLLHRTPPKPLVWLGFFPGNSELWGDSGIVMEEQDRGQLVDNYIRFEVSEGKLDSIATTLVKQYRKKGYKLGVCDCVSFAADACRMAGLGVPRVNLTPGGFVGWLRYYKSAPKFTHYNVRPFPWQPVGAAPPPKITGSYTVKAGDTLMNIAKKLNRPASFWKKLYEANVRKIGDNRDVIRVGVILTVPN